MNVLFNIGRTLRSLTMAPATAAVRQAHIMAQRRLAEGGAAWEPRSGDADPEDFVLSADVDAAAAAAAIRERLGIAGGNDPLHPLRWRKLGGRAVVRGFHMLRLGDGRFDRGRAFMHRVVREIRTRRRHPALHP
jgi:hypothetical protein